MRRGEKHKDGEREKKGFFSLAVRVCRIREWMGGLGIFGGVGLSSSSSLLTVSGGVSYGNRGEEEEAQPAKLRVQTAAPSSSSQRYLLLL